MRKFNSVVSEGGNHSRNFITSSFGANFKFSLGGYENLMRRVILEFILILRLSTKDSFLRN